MPGVYRVTATYNGSTNYTGSTSSPFTHTVSGTPTTTVASQSAASTVFGGPVTFGAQVAVVPPATGTPTGTATFTITGPVTVVLTGTLNASGFASVTTTALPLGTYSVVAAYSGDSTRSSSTSAPITHAVTAAPTTTVVTQTSSTTVYGVDAVFTATVASNSPSIAVPTGSVTFTVSGPGGFSVTKSLDAGGQAIAVGRDLPVGTYSVTATYTPNDVSFLTSTSSAITHNVTPAGTTTTVTQDSLSSYYGQSPVFTATVAAISPSTAVPAGTVTFHIAGPTTLTIIKSLDAAGTASAAGPGLPVGTYTVNVDYTPNTTNFTASSTTSPVTHVVDTVPTTTSLTQSAATTVYGQAPLFTATATANFGTAIPTGEIRFDIVGPLGTTTVLRVVDANGQATAAGGLLPADSYTVTATYLPDTADFGTSTSNTVTHTITTAAATTTLTQPSNTTYYGEEPPFTAHVTANSPSTAVPTGTVTFHYSGPLTFDVIKELDITGQATTFGRGLPAGVYTVTATFNGDTNFTPSPPSAPVTHTVLQALTTTTVVSPPTPSITDASEAFTLAAQVTVNAPGAGFPTGTVNFVLTGGPSPITVPATVNPATSTATATTSLDTGTYTLTANYLGDANFAVSSSAGFPITVVKASTTTQILSPPTAPNVVLGTTTQFSARVVDNVADTSIPTGTVTFGFTGTGAPAPITGTVDPATGVATASTSFAVLGAYTVTATYGGDGSHEGSTSSPFSFNVIVTVTGTATTIVGPPTPVTAVAGTPITAEARVAVSPPGPGTPTGLVTFTFVGPTTVSLTGTLSGGEASVTTAALPVGTYSLFAAYAGDGTFDPSTSTAWSLQITPVTSTTAILSPPTPDIAVLGENVSFTAAVTGPPGAGTPTGAVEFDIIGPTTLTLLGTLDPAGEATVNTNVLGIGTYSVVARYLGDTRFGTSTSAPHTLTIGKANTTVTAAQSSSASVFGETITTIAQVAVVAPGAGTPTGLVEFHVVGGPGVDLILSATVDANGRATIRESTRPPGAYTVTATYLGSSSFNASPVSDTLDHTVNPAPTTAVLSQNSSSTVYGQMLDLLATVNANPPSQGVPTGSVTFDITGPVSLSSTRILDANGQNHAFPRLPAGVYTVVATYTPNTGDYVGTVSNTVTHTVTAASTTSALVSPPPPDNAVFGQPVTFTVQVAADAPSTAIPTGTVSFTIDSLPTLTATVDPVTGLASVTVSALPVGGFTIATTYTPDSTNFSGSSSAPSSYTVGPVSTTAVLTQSSPTTVYGNAVTFTAQLSANAPSTVIPTGIVTFQISADGPPLSAAINPATGLASVTVSGLAPGPHDVTATYPDGTDFTGTVSNTVTHTVTQAATTTTIVSPPTPSTAVHGQTVTLEALVQRVPAGQSFSNPTGTVTFAIAGPVTRTLTAAVNATNGVATTQTSTLPAGSYTVVATYNGDVNYTGSVSSSFPLTIAKADTTTVIQSPPTPTTAPVDDTITLGARVSVDPPGAGSPTGTVDFTIAGPTPVVLHATVDPVTGEATASTSALSQGSYTVQAHYFGDTNDNASVSAPFSFTVVINVTGTVTTILSPPTPTVATQGDTITVAADVVGSPPGARTPTGTVDFVFSGPTTVTVSGTLDVTGVATANTNALAPGTYTLYAYYNGDLFFISSSSSAWTLTVRPLIADTTTTLLSPPTPTSAIHGQTVTFGAQVAVVPPGAGIPGGTVEFRLSGPISITLTGTLDGTGQATASTSDIPAGTHSVVTAYLGSTGFHASASSPSTLDITPAATTTTVTQSSSTSFVGETPVFTAQVTADSPSTAIPSGSVTFTLTGPTTITLTRELDATGQASASGRGLSAGAYTVSVTYTPNTGDFLPSTSSTITHTVTAATTSATLTQSPSTSVYGEEPSFLTHVVVTSPGAAIPAGTVTFTFTGPTTYAVTKELDASGQATALGFSLPVGLYTVTAVYTPASPDFDATTAPPLTHTVVPAVTTTVLTQNANTSVYGGPRTFQATVTANAPSAVVPAGSVRFDFTGTTSLTLIRSLDQNGQASASAEVLPAGDYTVTATYLPDDANFLTSLSDPLFHAITAADTTTTVTQSSLTTYYGEEPAFTAHVTANSPGVATPAGTVTFTIAGPETRVVTKELDAGGTAVAFGRGLPAGVYTITATFNGSANFNASPDSAPVVHIILAAVTSTTIESPPTPSTAVSGQTITLSATIGVNAPGTGTASGTVDFVITGGPYPVTVPVTVNPLTGVATVDISLVDPGTYTVVANYLGDGNFESSSSPGSSLTLSKAGTSTTILSPPSPTLVALGANAAFAAQVVVDAPGTGAPTGTITFDFTGPVTESLTGTVDPATGVAIVNIATLPAGFYTVTATYDGDANHSADTSDPFAFEVSATLIGTTTTIVGPPTPHTANAGDLITVEAEVTSGAGTPDGTVTFTFVGPVVVTVSATLAGGVATASASSLPLGSYILFAEYAGTVGYAGSSSAPWDLTINGLAGTTTILSPPTPATAVFGENVSLTAEVSGLGGVTPTGTVRFGITGTGGTFTLTGSLDGAGQATVNTNQLPLGSYSVVAHYLGDTRFVGSDSAPFTLGILLADTTVTLTRSSADSVFREPVTFTAQVLPVPPGTGTPTGVVVFQILEDGSSVTLSANVDGTGRASVVVGALPPGTATITATYLGESRFNSSASGTITHTITPATTTTTLTQRAATTVYGQDFDLQAQVVADAPSTGIPSGTIKFTLTGPVTVTVIRSVDPTGSASAVGRLLPVGTYAITAAYTPDSADYVPSVSAPLAHEVVATPTTTTILRPPTPATSVFGEPVTITAQVAAVAPSAASPAGTVTFAISGGPTLSAGLDPVTGLASVTLGSLALGPHAIVATFVPSSPDFLPSASAEFAHTVDAAGTTTTLSQSPEPTAFGRQVTFTAQVTATAPSTAVPTGVVTFLISGSTVPLIASVNPLTGVAVARISDLPAGTHPVTATFDGGADFGTSSDSLVHTVTKIDTGTSLSESSATTVFGENATFTALVVPVPSAPSAPSAPTGPVDFTFTGPTVVTLPAILSGDGTAVVVTRALPLGTYTVTATYPGDTNFNASGSGPLTHRVTAAATTLTLSSSPNPAQFGDTVSFTASVSVTAPGTGGPAGTVTFTITGPVSLTRTVEVNATTGLASTTIDTLIPGAYTVTASFTPGTSDFTGSTSLPMTQVVDKGNTEVTNLTAAPEPSAVGQAVTFSAIVSPVLPATGAPTGTVQFIITGPITLILPGLVGTGGLASATTSALPVGTYSVIATYGGDSTFNPSDSSTCRHMVASARTATTVTSAPNPSLAGQAVTFTATVAALPPATGHPTGAVTFTLTGPVTVTLVGTLNASGIATASTATLPVGTYRVIAAYGGDANFTASTSPVLSQSVTAPPKSATTTTLTSSSNPSRVGRPVSFTARVAPVPPATGTPTGGVTFTFTGPTTLTLTGTLFGGQVTVTTGSLAVGTYRVTANYAGDSAFTGSVSPLLAQSITI